MKWQPRAFIAYCYVLSVILHKPTKMEPSRRSINRNMHTQFRYPLISRMIYLFAFGYFFIWFFFVLHFYDEKSERAHRWDKDKEYEGWDGECKASMRNDGESLKCWEIHQDNDSTKSLKHNANAIFSSGCDACVVFAHLRYIALSSSRLVLFSACLLSLSSLFSLSLLSLCFCLSHSALSLTHLRDMP